jgi:hypothetical protein
MFKPLPTVLGNTSNHSTLASHAIYSIVSESAA